MKTDVSNILQYRSQVKAALKTCLKNSQNDVDQRLLSFSTTGKLLRGCLVCFSYQLNSGQVPTADVLETAAALELMHSALVIHDDIIDRDDVRRGRPAMHGQYRQLGEQLGLADPARFGEAMALCAGDITLFLAFGALPANAALKNLFSQVLIEVGTGQMSDIQLGLTAGGQPSKKAIYDVMRAKTATYSVALPLAAGAILADQPADVQKHLYRVGLAAGIIFQIRDDELGALGQTAELGKPVGADIREGKKTLLHYYLMRAASRRDKQRFQTIFGNQSASPADIAAVQKALRRYKIPTKLKQDITSLETAANRHIKQLKLNPAAEAKLRQMVKFCADRQF